MLFLFSRVINNLYYGMIKNKEDTPMQLLAITLILVGVFLLGQSSSK